MNIECYEAAWELRKLTEKFIGTKIAQDLQNFEMKNPEEDP